MPYRLLNVEDAVRTREGLKVEPGVRLRALLGRISDEDVPLPGDLIEIRFPDGGEDRAQVAAFGWEGLDSGGGPVSRQTDPTDPRFSLVIAGDLPPAAVPRGSEIWLVDHGPARRWNPGRGSDLLAQMARQPERPADPARPTALKVDPPEQPRQARQLQPPQQRRLDRLESPGRLEPPEELNRPEPPQPDSATDPAFDPPLKPGRNWRRFWRG